MELGRPKFRIIRRDFRRGPSYNSDISPRDVHPVGHVFIRFLTGARCDRSDADEWYDNGHNKLIFR